jgi:hypothetical protein
MLTHYQAPWPESPAPEGEPIRFFYEVDAVADIVLRSVELHADGSLQRNSLELEARDGWPCVSLWHGSFAELSVGVPLEPLSASTFEEYWRRAIDTP